MRVWSRFIWYNPYANLESDIFSKEAWFFVGLPLWLRGKESTCQAGDVGLIPGLGRAPGGGNGNPLQYSCLENPMGRGAWQTIVHGVAAESDVS